jgi:hypothetical protein
MSLHTLIFVFLCANFLIHGSARAAMGGEDDVAYWYSGEISYEGGYCHFTIHLDRVRFLVTTVANKYRFVPVLARCSGEAVQLSSSDDRFVAGEYEYDPAVAVLNLQQSDSELWDDYAADIRRMLAYPQQIEPDRPVTIFAYFPNDILTSTPYSFSYTISSLGLTAHMHLPPPTAAQN